MSDFGQDPYNVLDLPRNATEDEIKEAFRKLSLLWHPDKNPNGAGQFRAIYQAYQAALRDAKNRASYDSFTVQTRDPGTVNCVENYTGSGKMLRLARRWFPMPSGPDPENVYGKFKVAIFVGGVVVGAYVSYRIMQRSPPSIPVTVPVTIPEADVPQSAVQELSEIHPASLWTLVSWLAALRSKAVLRIGRLTSGTSVRLSSKALKGSLSAAADVVAKTVTQGPRAVSSVVSSASLTSAANVVAKPLPQEPKTALTAAAGVVAKTLTQGSQAGLSSASKTVFAETIKQGPSTGYSAAANEVTKKTGAGLLKYWKWTASSIGKGSAAVSPALANLKISLVKGATKG
ncbi:uncharacterized protein LOC127010476 [Drosophila biarmipes]|uniref:uncharacterized protein LOC127010476 n=1 Tax=Drosophila biarmipes TaxID=125945 RepID=UPI0007E83598|nr:uncharacterized protein LOC127010476 [Drosophila biarmipes]XP_043950729.1 uncharacterized protein LOC127010476 [Drosophila biarmipes]